jgi:hypothetical protein
MTIQDMITNARNTARENGESVDAYWGEYLCVIKLRAAYYGGFNVGNTGNYNRVRG